MNVCDVCAEMGAVNCKHCKHGNPCLGCADYDALHDTCTSNGACGDPDKKLKRADGDPDKKMKEQRNEID